MDGNIVVETIDEAIDFFFLQDGFQGFLALISDGSSIVYFSRTA